MYKGLKANSSYVNKLLSSIDIIFLSEHWLTASQQFIIDKVLHYQHTTVFHPAQKKQKGRTYGGNCFILKKGIFNKIEVIHEDDHILCIKASNDGICFIIAGVYLTSCHDNIISVESYKIELQTLTSLIESYADEGELIPVGDFQSFPSNDETCPFDEMFGLKEDPPSQE